MLESLFDKVAGSAPKKIQYSQKKHLCWRSEVAGLKVCNFIKKETPTQVLSCRLAKFLGSAFFIEHLCDCFSTLTLFA